MATDNTPPRLKLIVTIAVITVITLVGIDFVTKSYFAMMTDHAIHEKLAPTKDRNTQAEAEKTAFASAALPLDQAIAQLGKGTRPEAITPQASDDLGPMTGWSKLPKPAPAPHAHGETAPAADAGAPATAGDAGAHPAAAAAGDAGAKPHHPAAADAGAHR